MYMDSLGLGLMPTDLPRHTMLLALLLCFCCLCVAVIFLHRGDERCLGTILLKDVLHIKEAGEYHGT